MSKERPPRYEPPAARFGLTEQEQLWNRVSDRRLQTLLHDPATTTHRVEISINTYGEYLFLTLSRAHLGKRMALCFWGLGYHEQREQWILDHWRYYATNTQFLPNTTLTPDQTQAHLTARRRETDPQTTDELPPERAQPSATLADLGDEDGAYSELEDLEHLMGGLFGATPPPEDEEDV
jgi:hypothetical protein